ncbi:MAG TPA: mycothiol system anti-sigma-R factor [Kribbellaceae bacterium]
MSCGDPHETDCSEVLAEVWLYLDHECECERRELLRQHLDECSPCLARYGLEEQLKELLARKCGGDHAPEALRRRLRARIRTVMLEQTEVTVDRDEDGTTVEVRMRSTDLHEV